MTWLQPVMRRSCTSLLLVCVRCCRKSLHRTQGGARFFQARRSKAIISSSSSTSFRASLILSAARCIRSIIVNGFASFRAALALGIIPVRVALRLPCLISWSGNLLEKRSIAETNDKSLCVPQITQSNGNYSFLNRLMIRQTHNHLDTWTFGHVNNISHLDSYVSSIFFHQAQSISSTSTLL